MGAISATPRNSVLGALADALSTARDYGNRFHGAGDFLVGGVPDELNEWSYGNSPVHMSEMSNIPMIAPNRAENLLALAGMIPMAKPLLPAAKGISRLVLEGLAKRIESGAPEMAMLRPHYVAPPAPSLGGEALGPKPPPTFDYAERARFHPSTTESKAPQYEGQQQVIPGLRALQGMEKIGPNMWAFDSSTMNDTNLLDQLTSNLRRRAAVEGTSVDTHPNYEAFSMLDGVLADMRVAQDRSALYHNPNIRAILNIDAAGNPTAGASIDLARAKEAMAKAGSMDFTKEPIFMPHLSRMPNSVEASMAGFPETSASGRDIVRAVQDRYGPNVHFEVLDPEINEAVYRRMGATALPEADPATGMSLYGRKDLPAYEFTRPVDRKAVDLSPQDWAELAGQQRLPGFRYGGGF